MKIGFVGLGIMGESMSENIVKKHDDEVYVFDFFDFCTVQKILHDCFLLDS